MGEGSLREGSSRLDLRRGRVSLGLEWLGRNYGNGDVEFVF